MYPYLLWKLQEINPKQPNLNDIDDLLSKRNFLFEKLEFFLDSSSLLIQETVNIHIFIRINLFSFFLVI